MYSIKLEVFYRIINTEDNYSGFDYRLESPKRISEVINSIFKHYIMINDININNSIVTITGKINCLSFIETLFGCININFDNDQVFVYQNKDLDYELDLVSVKIIYLNRS
jgi:hypothetical protein